MLAALWLFAQYFKPNANIGMITCIDAVWYVYFIVYFHIYCVLWFYDTNNWQLYVFIKTYISKPD